MSGRRVAAAIGVIVALATAGCRTGPSLRPMGGGHTTRPSLPPITTTVPSPTTTTLPSFTSSVASVSAAQLGLTWHAGCPVDPSQLRALTMTYWGFDNQAHTGTMVVNVSVVPAVVQVFTTLYAARFPIDKMVPQSVYGEDDDAAAADDDTSGFNCRDAVAAGPAHWSMHAYGEAIDVNDRQNPYQSGSTVIPPAGAAYLDRTNVRPGMAVTGGVLVNAFAAVGWQWGGRWVGTPDYQHFSTNGE